MPLTTSGYRTFAPFNSSIRGAMRQRAYSLKVIKPSGDIVYFHSLSLFSCMLGKNISYIRSRAVYAEMFVGDSAEILWFDKNKTPYTLVFTRVK